MWIFWNKSSRFAEVENTSDRRSAVNFGAAFGLCLHVLTLGSWVLNKIWIVDLSSTLVGVLLNSPKLFLFFERISGVRLSLESFRFITVKHVAFFTVCAKVALTFTFYFVIGQSRYEVT